MTIRPLIVLLSVLLVAPIASGQTVTKVSGAAVPQLKIGLPVERLFGGREIHTYAFQLKTGQFASVLVDQRGIDVVLSVIAPDGSRLIETDSPNGTRGPERASIVAKTSGEHRIEIRPLEDTAESGKYEAILVDVRPAQRIDRINDLAARIAAAEHEGEADSLLNSEIELAGTDLGRAILVEGLRLRNTNLPRERLLVIFKRLLRLAERPQMRGVVGMANRGVGLAYTDLNKFDLAEEHLLRTIAYFEQFGERTKQGLAWTTRDLATVYARRLQSPKALELFERSRQLSHELGDKVAVVQTSNAIAVQYLFVKDLEKVEETLDAAIALSKTLNNPTLYTGTLQHAGAVFASQGRLAKAAEAFQEALRIAEDAGNVVLTVQNLYNVAKIQQRLGALSAAYANYQRVVELAPSAGDRSRKLNAMLNIASIHQRLNDDHGAVVRLQSILEFLDYELARDRRMRRSLIADKSGVLHQLAQIRLEQGNVPTAIALLSQALKMFDSEALAPEKSTRLVWELGPEYYFARQISTLRAIGDIQSSRRDHGQAATAYAQALSIAETSGYGPGIIETLLSISNNDAAQGKYLTALEIANRAIAIADGAGRSDYSLILNSKVADLLRRLGKDLEAERMYLEAIKLSELLRTDATTPEFRSNYFASLLLPYERYIDLLMERHRKEPTKGHDRAAFDISERRRARSLLESLKEARADIRVGVDAGLIEQENRVLNQLYDAASSEALSKDFSKTAQTADELVLSVEDASNKNIAGLTSDLRRIETAIRRASPRYATLTQPQPLTAAEIQAKVIDQDTVILNYTLGDTRSFLWAISKTSINGYSLPSRSEIEAVTKKVHSLLANGSNEEGSELENESRKLSEMILAPAAGVFGQKRIVVVADGALQYLPFSSLPDPRADKSTQSLMIDSNEVTYAPSGSVLNVLRGEVNQGSAAVDSVAVFGDPVFSDNDDRFVALNARQLPKDKKGSSLTTRTLHLAQLASGGLPTEKIDIPRLPFSRREAESIFGSGSPSHSMKALDFDATREKALNGDLGKYRIVHFATHGILHSEHPELSGIVLSLVNEKREPINGFLRLNDIYNLRLNADLVVLSACQTALGKDIRGEGLLGLTRGFMYAGSPRVVASLWKVDDVATAELMKIFYQKMLKEKMRPAAALREAKIAVRKQKRWSSPYYWAAFELQGEWR